MSVIRLQENGVNGILADEMGLGKVREKDVDNINLLHVVNISYACVSNFSD